MAQVNVPSTCLLPTAVPPQPPSKQPSTEEKTAYINQAKDAALLNKDHSKLTVLPHNDPTPILGYFKTIVTHCIL